MSKFNLDLLLDIYLVKHIKGELTNVFIQLRESLIGLESAQGGFNIVPPVDLKACVEVPYELILQVILILQQLRMVILYDERLWLDRELLLLIFREQIIEQIRQVNLDQRLQVDKVLLVELLHDL
eukprot:CAMPEP_0170566514 /NCGR_PEP_ID=MMETSP0211-20121228/79890_1 /TAXON_ID=311385 /ORGANISM="Pseudokeronopsis sp., Strain OXSARD2" /LENGTH=124 /DNA_ID=CAMNT_0010887717 /DNA_START=1172 /DNA_END=1546 /DNA_ORIENTATION=-